MLDPTLKHFKRTMTDVADLISRWQLSPHPEGGWYREMHRSSNQVTRADGSRRDGLTSILFLLEAGAISRWHRVRGADEVWIHLQGAPLELFSLESTGGTPTRTVLTADHPIEAIKANHWQAARCLGSHTLVSCCVGPAFDFADFDMLQDLPRDQWPAGASDDLL
ncbi:conserved hypothetical protein DUF985 [Synechococcus sp. WH 8101]|nr:conserved hypothetical protein DUF985 [Synechococcus sp. WH 8101]